MGLSLGYRESTESWASVLRDLRERGMRRPLLVIGTYFKTLPSSVGVVEIEPRAHEFGSDLTPEVAAAVPKACDAIRALLAEVL